MSCSSKICPHCSRIVMADWQASRGRFYREPNPDEKAALIERHDPAVIRLFGFSEKGVPGGDHVCDPRPRPRPLDEAVLHLRPVRLVNLMICRVCDHAVAVWPDLPYTVDPGFVQRRMFNSMRTASERAEHPFAFCPTNGTASPHECPPMDRRQADRDRDRECGEGQGRA